MKIATWNVERLRHASRLPEITELCKRQRADIFVVTETDTRLELAFKHCFKAFMPTDTGASYKPTESRVSIFTNYDIVKQHTTFDDQTAVCVELQTEHGNLTVYGVVMGIYGNRHESYKRDLPLILADVKRLTVSGIPLCVVGDYNCSFSDNYYYTAAGRLAIEKTFSECGLELLTRDLPQCIDHIAISRKALTGLSNHISEWNLDKSLSDHKGVAVEI